MQRTLPRTTRMREPSAGLALASFSAKRAMSDASTAYTTRAPACGRRAIPLGCAKIPPRSCEILRDPARSFRSGAQVLFVYERVYETNGSWWPHCAHRLMLSLVIAHATLAGVFALKLAGWRGRHGGRGPDMAALWAGPLLLPLPFATAMAWRHFDRCGAERIRSGRRADTAHAEGHRGDTERMQGGHRADAQLFAPPTESTA